MEFDFSIYGKTYRISLDERENGFEVEVDGSREVVNATFVDPNTISLLLGNRAMTAYVAFDGEYHGLIFLFISLAKCMV